MLDFESRCLEKTMLLQAFINSSSKLFPSVTRRLVTLVTINTFSPFFTRVASSSTFLCIILFVPRSLRNLVGPLHLTMNDISSDLNNLVRTFRSVQHTHTHPVQGERAWLKSHNHTNAHSFEERRRSRRRVIPPEDQVLLLVSENQSLLFHCSSLKADMLLDYMMLRYMTVLLI